MTDTGINGFIPPQPPNNPDKILHTLGADLVNHVNKEMMQAEAQKEADARLLCLYTC